MSEKTLREREAATLQQNQGTVQEMTSGTDANDAAACFRERIAARRGTEGVAFASGKVARDPALPEDASLGELVLLVEDDPGVQEFMSAVLRHGGYEVKIAANGAEGVREALRLRPAVILMDVGLPVLDGWDATAEIKASAPELCVVMLTAYSLPEHARRAKSVGADRFIGKPVEPREVLRVVRECIAERRCDAGSK